MKCYDENKPLDSDTLEVGLGTGQITWPRDSMPDNYILKPKAFASKSLSRAETFYNNIERKALAKLHGLLKSITTVLTQRYKSVHSTVPW